MGLHVEADHSDDDIILGSVSVSVGSQASHNHCDEVARVSTLPHNVTSLFCLRSVAVMKTIV
jgi:hypothetical protein